MTLNIWAYFLFISLSWSGQQVHNILTWHCYFLVQDQAFLWANHIFFCSLLEKCAKWHSTGYDQQHNKCPPNWCLEFFHFPLASEEQQYPNQYQQQKEFPSGLPSEFCPATMVLNFSVQMGTWGSNRTTAFYPSRHIRVIFGGKNKEVKKHKCSFLLILHKLGQVRPKPHS